jgi:perosamine synthetase
MIPLMKVYVSPEEQLMPKLKDILYSGMLTEGEKVKEFETKFQSKFQLRTRPLSVNNCTMALQIAYRCAGVRGKYVITTPMTCTATNMPIFSEGGKIIWSDIDPNTGNICPIDVERKILKYGPENIGAIAFVDFAGFPANLDSLVAVSKKYSIPLVEDAAQSLGATWRGEYIGNQSDYVAFSFQAIKHLTTGDGGALINNTDTWELSKRVKWYGINREAVKEATRWHYDIPDWGYKGHMNNVNATIGLVQLDNISDVISRHKDNGRWFDAQLKDVSGVTTMAIPHQSDPSYWIYMLRVEKREDFAQHMLSAGVGVNVAHIRNDSYTCFQDPSLVLNHGEERPGLEVFNNEYISIPCGWWVSDEDREYILGKIEAGW